MESKLRSIIMLIVVLSTILAWSAVNAVELELSWTPNPESELVVGYKIYHKTDTTEYIELINISAPKLNEEERVFYRTGIDQFDRDTQYFFTVTAYNDKGIESAKAPGIGLYLTSRPSAPTELDLKYNGEPINIIINIGTTFSGRRDDR